jgi:hypothetical protein
MQPEPDVTRKRAVIAPLGCEDVLDLIPALAFGAIETGAERLVRQHCATCEPCATELAESERVTRFLPLSVPQRAPSPHAKLALMERIQSPAPAFAAAALHSPIIESPAAKRAAKPTDSSRGTDLMDWTRELVSGRTKRLAAAPIALALVLVSLYGLGTFEPSEGENALVPTAQAATTDTGNTIASTSDLDVTFLSAPATGGATVTMPTSSSVGASGSTFMARSNRALAQTELLRTVAPAFAECSLEKVSNGTWYVEVTGVSLANRDQPANVYLVSRAGELVEVGDVTLDQQGNGVVSFSLDQPMSEFSFIQIGSGSTGSTFAGQAPQHYTFQIDLAARLSQGLGRPD